MKRLYCAGEGENRRFCLTTSNMAAAAELAVDEVRIPTADDIRCFWERSGLSGQSYREAAAAIGVSYQTICNWRQKAGDVGPTRAELAREKYRQLVAEQMAPGSTVADVSSRVGIGRSTVSRIAEELGLRKRGQFTKRPSDDDLVKLAKGRTWREFADACGMAMGSLRNYIYAKPELSQKIRDQLARQPTGGHAHGRVPPDEVARMFKAGMTAHAISELLRVEPMSVRNCLAKLGLIKVPYLKGAKGHDTTGVATDE